jgi:hypothetical protein
MGIVGEFLFFLKEISKETSLKGVYTMLKEQGMLLSSDQN